MEAFTQLRNAARDKRDKAIHAAKEAYVATLTRIAALEQDVFGREESAHKTISECVMRVLPTDRQFTLDDLLASLEAMNPAREWRRRAVESVVFRLRERGIVKRVRRSKGTECAVYACKGVAVKSNPFGDKTLPEVAWEVLGERALNATELAVAMKEAGYDTAMKLPLLRRALLVAMRADRIRFAERAGKWRVV